MKNRSLHTITLKLNEKCHPWNRTRRNCSSLHCNAIVIRRGRMQASCFWARVSFFSHCLFQLLKGSEILPISLECHYKKQIFHQIRKSSDWFITLLRTHQWITMSKKGMKNLQGRTNSSHCPFRSHRIPYWHRYFAHFDSRNGMPRWFANGNKETVWRHSYSTGKRSFHRVKTFVFLRFLLAIRSPHLFTNIWLLANSTKLLEIMQ